MSGLGKDMSGMVRISRDEVRAGTFPDTDEVTGLIVSWSHVVVLVVGQCNSQLHSLW